MNAVTVAQEKEIKTTAERLIEVINGMTPEQQQNALYLIEGVAVGQRAAEKCRRGNGNAVNGGKDVTYGI